MSDDNKRNLLYFESASMRELYNDMETWQNENRKRLLSVSIEQDGDNYCCIALTNPTEVIIRNGNAQYFLEITQSGAAKVENI